MEDLYIEPYQPTEDELTDRHTPPHDCDGCQKPLVPGDVPIFLVGTMNGQTPMCAKCAERVYRSWKGTKHDRREDAEKLLTEISEALVFAKNAKTNRQEGDALDMLVTFLPRISRR